MVEHYGKVVVVLAAVLLTIVIVGIVNTKTKTAVESITYEQQIEDAIMGTD